MSIYAYFVCHDCKQSLWLGKSIHLGTEGDYKPLYFHIGSADEAPHWKREELNQVIWKFLADHTNHNIRVLLEHDMTDEMRDYQKIGGDRDNDIRIQDYLRGWQGFR